MSNKHTSQPPTEMMRARLKVLLEHVNYLYTSKESVLEEDIVNAYNDAISIFMRSLDGSIVGTVAKILKGAPADPSHYNILTNSIAKDLEATYLEAGTLDRLITSSFNSIIAEREQVIQVSRRVSDKLGTYLLYADPALGGGYFFGDSFNSPENIEVGSSLVDVDECFLGQNEGVILLPLDGDPDKPRIKSYIINKPSNGTSGNDQELGVVGKKDIEAIGDSEPNTWYEYERVTAYESNSSLVFDLTIVLDEISVINHIHINPINFGTPTPVNIVKLETSKDGLEYVSVKDEVPIKDFVSEEEDNTFELSPATAKFAGQGLYSFLPRKTQYVHIVLEQYTPYAINTSNGSRLRYAIGIRDIDILGRKFKPKGAIVSTPFTIGEEARKVALWASENPIEASALADITHSISENDGAVWRPLQPQQRSSFNTPEVIDFNTIAEGAIQTDSPVEVLRHKISMTRNTDAFSGNITLKEERLTQVDVLNVPTGGDFSFATSQQPISETVRVILPFYGSYSCPTVRYGSAIVGASTPMDLDFLEFNIDVPPTDTLRFKLPFSGIENLPEHIRVFVNGEQIEYSPKDETAMDTSITSYSAVDEDSKVYFLNKGGREIQFGFVDSNGDRRGFLPLGGARVQVCLDGDNPRLELTDAGYVLLLSANSDGFKENVDVVSMDSLSEEEAMDHSIELSPGKDKSTVTKPIKILGRRTAKYTKPEDFGRVGKSTSLDATNLNIFDGASKMTETGVQSVLSESKDGSLPPVFLPSSSTWKIVEYDLTTGYPITSGEQFSDKQTFIDGRQELISESGGVWSANTSAYSFDPYSGTVYLGSLPSSSSKTMFYCKILQATQVPVDSWDYYKTSIHGRIDTQKIVIDPKYVVTNKRTTDVDGTSTPFKSIQLLGSQTIGHDWFKQRLVKGTIVIDPDIFPAGTKATETSFIDGDIELHSIVQMEDEAISFTFVSTAAAGDLYSFDLGSIDATKTLNGIPGFASVREIDNPNTTASIFTDYIATTPLIVGNWTYSVDSITGVCTIQIRVNTGTDMTTLPHTVSYKYNVVDPGVDMSGLYSVDYETGTIHFAENMVNAGTIQFEVSAYTAFYNIAEVIDEKDITEIDEEGRKITISTALGMKFLKLTTAMKARPSFAKIVYDYYKTSSESLEDLEPYFSPICKDIAFKAVTVSTLEEL